MTTIAVVGAGRMGRGLAHVFAYAGHPITLIDTKPRANDDHESLRSEAFADIERSLGSLVEFGAMPADKVSDIVGRIAVVADESPLETADVVFEAVPETLDAKREALTLIGRRARPEAIVASATSSMLVDELAAMVIRPQRFLNAHWLNPAHIIPLVEVSPGSETDAGVVECLEGLLKDVGKVPVVCAASPGFIVPRLQALAMNEAARLVEEGVATPEAIDTATRFGLGFRFAAMGVVEFIDWGGGDTLYRASEYLRDRLGAERYAPPDTVRENIESGAIGVKTGRGFHDYAGRDMDAYQKETLGRFLALLSHYDLLKPPA
ncbi:MAG: 3-hydroxybutyryl-CoA dehydrogenase [Alphaproteobacteria bacterium]|nr:3-hydroxybutyryl-CoA dehydrogenase [Alphaproteobacteria bacterium]